MSKKQCNERLSEPKTQRYSVYGDIKQREAADPQNLELAIVFV